MFDFDSYSPVLDIKAPRIFFYQIKLQLLPNPLKKIQSPNRVLLKTRAPTKIFSFSKNLFNKMLIFKIFKILLICPIIYLFITENIFFLGFKDMIINVTHTQDHFRKYKNFKMAPRANKRK